MSEPIEMYFNDFIKLNRGFDLPESNIVAGKYPIAASTSIKDYHKDFKVKAPCVTTGRSGSLGSVLFINQDCWPLNTTLYVKDFKGNNPKYVYYFLQTMKLESFNCGAGVPTLNQNHLHKVKVKIHKKDEQHRIASILYAYDDLIENNSRRIALLEQMAEQIYKEWFVRMRFPGYQNMEFEKGVPKGWDWKKVEEVFKTSSGGTPSRQKEQEYYGGNIDWIKTGELKDNFIFDSEEKITDSGLKNSSAKLFPPHTLLMAMYGVNIGQLGISVKPSTANQAVCVFLPKEPKQYSLYYTFFFFKSIRSHLFNISMGAAQQNLSQDIIKRLNYLKPETSLLLDFEGIQKPMFDEILKLSQQNQTLKQTRDLLLPRLISGKLKVNELKEFELV